MLAVNPSILYFCVGIPVLSRWQNVRASVVNFSTLGVTSRCDTSARGPCFARFMSSKSSEKRGQTESEVCVQFEFVLTFKGALVFFEVQFLNFSGRHFD